MRKLKLLFQSSLLAAGGFLFSCSGPAGSKQMPGIPESPAPKPAQQLNPDDTLADTPIFSLTVDGKQYPIEPASVVLHYNAADSTLSITAGKDDTLRLELVIADSKHMPGYRPNGWRSHATKLAGTDSLVYHPTVAVYRKKDILFSWNNLDDGKESKWQPDRHSLYIYSLRSIGNHRFRIKGRVLDTVRANVFASAAPQWNHDQLVEASFVLDFEDYWLQL